MTKKDDSKIGVLDFLDMLEEDRFAFARVVVYISVLTLLVYSAVMAAGPVPGVCSGDIVDIQGEVYNISSEEWTAGVFGGRSGVNFHVSATLADGYTISDTIGGETASKWKVGDAITCHACESKWDEPNIWCDW